MMDSINRGFLKERGRERKKWTAGEMEKKDKHARQLTRVKRENRIICFELQREYVLFL